MPRGGLDQDDDDGQEMAGQEGVAGMAGGRTAEGVLRDSQRVLLDSRRMGIPRPSPRPRSMSRC